MFFPQTTVKRSEGDGRLVGVTEGHGGGYRVGPGREKTLILVEKLPSVED